MWIAEGAAWISLLPCPPEPNQPAIDVIVQGLGFSEPDSRALLRQEIAIRHRVQGARCTRPQLKQQNRLVGHPLLLLYIASGSHLSTLQTPVTSRVIVKTNGAVNPSGSPVAGK